MSGAVGGVSGGMSGGMSGEMSGAVGGVSDTGFVVIGAGLPRTGTLSLKVALTQLLGGPYNDNEAAISAGTVYHMVDVMMLDGRNGKHSFWFKAAKGEVNKEDWISFLEGRGYRAGVDYPLSFHWKELMEVFPHAKVVLSMRSADTWYESCKNTIVRCVTKIIIKVSQKKGCISFENQNF